MNMELESDYAYTGRDGKCKYSASKATNVSTTKQAYVAVTPKNVKQMKAAVAEMPLAVSVDAAGRQFMNYKKGIYDHENMIVRLDHATLVVGWGTESGTDYWIMKNSWNTSWGEKGYMRLKIEDGVGVAGIQKEPLQALVNN